MNYCDFNPRLFKEFISMKTKIHPAMADDWEILTTSYNTNQGFKLYSKKINQTVADIQLRRFLDFCKEQNLVIEGLNLKGNYIIGNDRSVYTEAMYNTWRDKFEVRTEGIVDKKNLEIGHQYKTPCGRDLIYLGARYVAKIKETSFREGNYGEFSKIVKKHFVASTFTIGKKVDYSVDELKNKLTTSIGKKLNEDRTEELLNDFYKDSQQIVCFEKEKPSKTVKFGVIKQEGIEKIYDKTRYRYTLLFKDSDGILYGFGSSYGSICSIYVKNGEFYTSTYGKLSDDLVCERSGSSYYYGSRNSIKVHSFFRIGII